MRRSANQKDEETEALAEEIKAKEAEAMSAQ